MCVCTHTHIHTHTQYTYIHCILGMSRSNLKDRYWGRSRHFFTDQYWLLSPIWSFVLRQLSQSFHAQQRNMCSCNQLSAELHVCRAGLSPARSETPHTINDSKTQYETVYFCYLSNLCAPVSFINVKSAKDVHMTKINTQPNEVHSGNSGKGWSNKHWRRLWKGEKFPPDSDKAKKITERACYFIMLFWKNKIKH